MARKRRVWCVRDGFGAMVRGGKGCVRMVFVWSGAARQFRRGVFGSGNECCGWAVLEGWGYFRWLGVGFGAVRQSRCDRDGC